MRSHQGTSQLSLSKPGPSSTPLGVEATPANLAKLKQQKAREAKIAEELLNEAQSLSDAMAGKVIRMNAKVGEGGRLFGAIASKEIAQEIKNQLGLDVDKKKIVLPEPIKTLGKHEISIKLHKDVTAKVDVEVTEE